MDLFLVLAAFVVSSLRFSLFFLPVLLVSGKSALVEQNPCSMCVCVREREAFCVKDRWEIDVHEFLTVD